VVWFDGMEREVNRVWMDAASIVVVDVDDDVY